MTSSISGRAPIPDPIVGDLVVSDTLIIYNDGYYSLDGGATTSTDTIGPETQIKAAASTSISIILMNANEVTAKRISVPGGSLTVTGGGMLTVNNQDVAELSRTPGVRVYGALTIDGGATLSGTGFTDGIYAANSSYDILVTGNSTLIGEVTGTNASILNASKYGVNSARGIQVDAGSSIRGTGISTSWNTYGVSADIGHSGRGITCYGQITGSAETGVYSGGTITIGVGALLTGIGGSHNISHGVQADRTNIIVQSGGRLDGICSDGAYAGVLTTTNGITVNGGQLNGVGGIHGVRAAGSGNILLTDGGTITGTGNQTATSYGVYAVNNITVNDGALAGTGGRDGVFAGGSIDATDGVVEGFTFAYGQDASGYYGAVIANGTIAAADTAQIIENYSRVEYYGETFRIPYENGKNMTDYLNYNWAITAGTGNVASDPGGSGIHATQSGSGTLTAARTGGIPGEVVLLDAGSSHIIHIPVELDVAEIDYYMVTYDGNGATDGTVPVDSNLYPANAQVVVLGNTGNLVREGFEFVGWALNPTDTEPLYEAGSTFIMPANDVTLYAVWKEAIPAPPTPSQPCQCCVCRCRSCCCGCCCRRWQNCCCCQTQGTYHSRRPWRPVYRRF